MEKLVQEAQALFNVHITARQVALLISYEKELLEWNQKFNLTRITDPQEIVPALKRGLAAVDGGQATVLEFITAEEGEYSKFVFR